MRITVSVDSDATHRLLRRSPSAAARATDGTLNDASSLYLLDLKDYPPSRPGSNYKRTRTLARAWSRQFSGSGLTRSVLIGSNRNIAPYNRRVQDETMQARIHGIVWREKTVQAVHRRNERRVGEFLQRRVDREFANL